MATSSPQTIDEYIDGFPPEVAQVLTRLRQTVRAAAPSAREVISYGMPTFRDDRVLLHFGAFKGHIGIYPPLPEPQFAERTAPYRGPKGNLRLPLDAPIPYDLVADTVRARVGGRSA